MHFNRGQSSNPKSEFLMVGGERGGRERLTFIELLPLSSIKACGMMNKEYTGDVTYFILSHGQCSEATVNLVTENMAAVEATDHAVQVLALGLLGNHLELAVRS